MRWWRARYGAHPLHLVLLLGCFAVAAYAVTRIHDQGGVVQIALWFGGALVVHDLIGFPLYAGLDRAARRRSAAGVERRRAAGRAAVPWINHVRVPVVIAGTLLLVSFPLVLRRSATNYQLSSGLTENRYLFHWLAVTGVLLAGSAAGYAGRLVRARRSPGRPAPASGQSGSSAPDGSGSDGLG
jgi:hypothetical protein